MAQLSSASRRYLNPNLAICLAAAMAVSCTTADSRSRFDLDPSEANRTARSAAAPASIDPTIALIREEGIDRSQVMQTLDHLCNVIGPRLTASQRLRDANEWTRTTLEGWGLENAHLEEWGPFGREWNVRRFSLQGVEPFSFAVIGYPRGWSPGLEQPTTGEVVFLDATRESDLEQFKGKLKDKFVLIGQPRTVEARFLPLATRQDDERLARLADARPGQAARDAAPVVENAAERRARFMASSGRNERMLNRTTSGPSTTPASQPASQPTSRRGDPFTTRLIRFAADEGAAVTLFPSTVGDGGTFFVTSAVVPPKAEADAATRPATTRSTTTSRPTTAASDRPTRPYDLDAPTFPPQITLAVEDYNRLARGSRLGEVFKLEADVKVEFSKGNAPVVNTIAEIPGTDLKDEIVMVGAHLDSWHSGTGASDNAVGSACAMEAVRIIKVLGLKPRRTIRVGLWTGEEQGIHGSAAYVEKHFGHVKEDESSATRPTSRRSDAPREIVKLPDYEKLSAYYNLDNGTGRIRGIYAQGNERAMPFFREWLKPFADLGAQTVTLTNTGGTDHLSFDEIGLPGFQFIQDPIEYSTRTHHSNMDVFDRIQAEDMKQASTIMAAFLWNTANMDERFPRKPVGETNGD